jgi:hypothetical protein
LWLLFNFAILSALNKLTAFHNQSVKFGEGQVASVARANLIFSPALSCVKTLGVQTGCLGEISSMP